MKPAFCLVASIARIAFLLAVLFSGVFAAKVGDMGKGWKIVEDADGRLQCQYNGKFEIEGNYREINTATGTKPCPSPRPLISRFLGKKVFLGQGKNTVWRIKTGSGGAETIRSVTNKKYLTPLTNVVTAEWNTDVVMGLSKKKSRYSIVSNGDTDDRDCLKDVDLISDLGTRISYDCASAEFRYDSDQSFWNLIPV